MFVVPSFFGFQDADKNLDDDYQAILDYATTQGYTLPSSGQQSKQNKLVVDLKEAGIWSKLDTFAVFATDAEDTPGSNTSDFALIDWKRLSQYTAFNSPTFNTNGGFTGNGTSSHINTNFNPATSGLNYTQNNASRFYWVDNISTGIWEGITTANRNDTRGSNSAAQKINQGNSPNSFTTQLAFDGWHSINRFSSTEINIFINDQSNPNSSNSASIDSQNQLVLRGGNNFNASRFRLYGMGASLVSENTNFYNAVNTYLISL
jgi:hypothetical protein